MNNILFLGAGYVGTELFKRANKEDNNYWLRSRQELDYSNSLELRKFILNNDISYVINCSGFTGSPNVDEGELKKKKCWYLNVLLPLKLSKICKSIGVGYIHISSGCIYSGYEKEYVEQDEPNFGLYDNSSFYS